MADAAILKQIIQESGLKYEQNSVSYIFTCPLCASPKKLYIRKADGRFVCWKCKETQNYQGKPEFALADLMGQPVGVIQARLYGREGVQARLYLDVKLVDFFGDEDDTGVELAEAPAVEWPLDYHPLTTPHGARGAQYMKGRGVPLWMAAQYGLHYCPPEGRVAFPVTAGGRLYGWQARVVGPDKWVDDLGRERTIPKILSSPGLSGVRGNTLMFADRLVGSEHAVLTEGPVDALKAHFCGGNVCAMGKAVSAGQIQLMLDQGVKKLYLGLDPDAADEVQRLVRKHFDDVELYQLHARVKGAREKADLGAMAFQDVLELFLDAERISGGQVFVFLDPHVA